MGEQLSEICLEDLDYKGRYSIRSATGGDVLRK